MLVKESWSLVVMLDNAQWKSTNGSIAASIVIFQQFCGHRWWFCLRFGDWLSLTWLVILIDSKFTRLATRWLWTEAIVVVSLSNLVIYYFLFFFHLSKPKKRKLKKRKTKWQCLGCLVRSELGEVDGGVSTIISSRFSTLILN